MSEAKEQGKAISPSEHFFDGKLKNFVDDSLIFIVPGPCVPKGRPKASAIRMGTFAKINMRTPEKTVTYESNVYQRCVEAMETQHIKPMTGQLRVRIMVYKKIPKSMRKRDLPNARAGWLLPTTKPDLDNQIKSLIDAISGVICGDDAAICEIRARKRYDDGEGERAIVMVEKLLRLEEEGKAL